MRRTSALFLRLSRNFNSRYKESSNSGVKLQLINFFILLTYKISWRIRRGKTESVPLRFVVNGKPGSCPSTSKVATQEAATTPEGEKPAAVLPSKEEEGAKNLSTSKDESTDETFVETVVEPKTFSAVVEVNVCLQKSQ